MSIHEQSLDGEDEPTVDEADPEVKLGDLEALRGVVKFPVRIKCATLSWNTLAQGLDEVRRPPTSYPAGRGLIDRRGEVEARDR